MPSYSSRSPSRTAPPTRSDVATRSTGYEEEQERWAAWRASGGQEEQETQGQEAEESETPVLDQAEEVDSGSSEPVDHDAELEAYWAARGGGAQEEEQQEEQSQETTPARQETTPAREETQARTEEPAPRAREEREASQARAPAQEVGLPAMEESTARNARAVTGKAMKRLGAAKAAINHTKKVLKHGAGNQFEALKDTKFNSYFRMAAMRDPECWELDPALIPMARKYPDALTAAKADLAQGGNCGEHAALAFDFLASKMGGEQVNKVSVAGLDHAFVIIGNLAGDKDADMAVCDPWPTGPTACLWDEHFAFKADRSQIKTANSSAGGQEDIKAMFASGLRLSAKGEAMIQQSLDQETTDKELEKGTQGDHPWIWQHRDAVSGRARPYRTAGGQGQS